MFFLAYKGLMHQMTRTVLSIIGLAIAVIGFISLVSVSLGFNKTIKDYYQFLDGAYVVRKGSIDPIFSSLPASYEKPLNTVEGVHNASPELWVLSSYIEGRDSFSSGIFAFTTICGVDIKKNLRNKEGGVYFRALQEGRPLNIDDEKSVLISTRTAEEYNKKVNDQINIDGHECTVAGIYETGSFLQDSAIVVPIDFAYEISKKSREYVSTYYLDFADNVSEDEVIDQITNKVEATSVRRSSSWMDDFKGILSNINMFVGTVIFFAVLISITMVLNTTFMNVNERRREFGIMIGEGWTKLQIMRLILFESWILTGIGAVIGIVISLGVYQFLMVFLPFPPVMNLLLILESLLLSGFVGTIGALVPYYKIKNLKASEILRSI